jgi:predicted Zn-dependent protease with MMP-like domain
MDQGRFARLVVEALDALPPEIAGMLDNVEVVVEPYPTRAQLRAGRVGSGRLLLGLYEGVPRTQRSTGYGMVLPDKITIFQQPIEAICRNEEEIRAQVRSTVVHEIAHHLGIGDEELRRLGY